jgi:hypothetical protein
MSDLKNLKKSVRAIKTEVQLEDLAVDDAKTVLADLNTQLAKGATLQRITLENGSTGFILNLPGKIGGISWSS